jgi:two-component system, LuxR family, response regulator FixJ
MHTIEPLTYLVDGDAGALKDMAGLLQAAGLRVAAFDRTDVFLQAHDPAQPGCAVIDVRSPGLDGLNGLDGLALLRELQQCGAERAIVFVAGGGDVELGVRAMKAGADDFLIKPLEVAGFVAAVRHALARDAHERAVRRELQRIRAHFDTLTRREEQVLRHVVSGRLNKQIAFDLGIAEKTIKVHRARVMEKMGATSLAQLVRETLELEAGAVFAGGGVDKGGG